MLMRTTSLLAIPSSDLQHTIGHIDCPACEADRVAMARTTDLKLLTFRDASLICLHDEQRNIVTPGQARTHKDHGDFTRRLNRFFGELVLQNIHEAHFLNYQRERLQTAGAELINHETSFLSHVLDKAGLWAALKPKCHRLKVPKSKAGHALIPENRERLLICAASDPRWQVAYNCTLLTANTGVGAGEIRHIRVEYMDVRHRRLGVLEGVKNDFRIRYMPMTATVLSICNVLLKRYYKLCQQQGVEPSPQHYVLPFLQTASRRGKTRLQIGGPSYDFTRPMSSWRSAWESLREKAGLPHLRMYDLRHTVSTEWQEDPRISNETIAALMGHSNTKTQKLYADIRDKSKLEALELHEVKRPPRIFETLEALIELPDVSRKGPESVPVPVAAVKPAR